MLGRNLSLTQPFDVSCSGHAGHKGSNREPVVPIQGFPIHLIRFRSEQLTNYPEKLHSVQVQQFCISNSDLDPHWQSVPVSESYTDPVLGYKKLIESKQNSAQS